MYTLLIVFFLAAPSTDAGVSVHSREVRGFTDENACKGAAEKASKDLSGDIPGHAATVVRTSCIAVSK